MIAASLKQLVTDDVSPEEALVFTDRGTTPYDDGYMDTVQYLTVAPIKPFVLSKAPQQTALGYSAPVNQS